MTQEKIRAREESLKELRSILIPGNTVYTLVRSVARSGMSRRISLFIIRNNDIRDITWHVARALDYKLNDRHEGILVSGCGMDMCFHLVYSLGRALFPDGFGVEGSTSFSQKFRPASRERAATLVEDGAVFYGRNGDHSGWDNDGGYALNKRSLQDSKQNREPVWALHFCAVLRANYKTTLATNSSD